MNRIIAAGLSVIGLLFATAPASAAGQYGPGASDTEVKIGNTMPYSGPASAYGIIGKTEAAYFTMINEQGGINGRKINFISRDDGYSPPKTVERSVRRPIPRSTAISMIIRCRNCSSPLAPINGMIPSIFPGRWA